MNQLEPKRSSLDRDLTCTELLRMAQRELSALSKAVNELFGAEQAELSAEDWLQEVEASRTLPASVREWREITIKVMAQLASRCGRITAVPVSSQLQPAGY